MRPTMELPTVRPGVKTKSPARTERLQQAFHASLGMAGLQRTKVGAGDKERGYIVRQNTFLRWLMILFILVVAGFVVLSATILEVKVTRRSAIGEEIRHHRIEHQAQVKLIDAHLHLQETMEQHFRNLQHFEVYRSQLEKMLGNFGDALEAQLKEKKVAEDIIKVAEENHRKTREAALKPLNRNIERMHNSLGERRERMKSLAGDVMEDVRLDEEHEKAFEEVLRSMNAMHELHEEKAYRMKMQRQAQGKSSDDEDFVGDSMYRDDENNIEQSLEKFFEKVRTHTFPTVTNDIIKHWEGYYDEISKLLQDQNKETDMAVVRKKVSDLVTQTHGVKDFDPSKHGNILDYFESLIEEAKLGTKKQELLDVYDGWKASPETISPYTVLANIERFGEEHDLFLLYEWLEGVNPDSADGYSDSDYAY